MPRKCPSSAQWKGWACVATSAIAAFVGVAFAVPIAHAPAPRPQTVLAVPPAPAVPLPVPVPRVEPAAMPAPSPPPAPVEPQWRRYAKPAAIVGGWASIAIVVDDLGPDRTRTDRAIGLPAALTLAFMPYAADVRQQAEAARARGHELLVHVPMQPLSRAIDMGPNGLAVDLTPDELMRRLRWNLDRFDAYVGINNHMGSRFTADADAMRLVIGELKARGLMFLDSRTSGGSVGALVARQEGVPFAERDVFLDDDQSAAAIAARLRDVEATAHRTGNAVAIGHPHDATLAALAAWVGTLPEKHVALVPLTEIVRLRAGTLRHPEVTRTVAR